jgi:hypothetical protein
MKNSFPIHGVFGILFLFLSGIFLFRKVEPFYSWFYCFAWWSYILAVDALIYRLKGTSLILSRRKEFLLMIPWSVFIWLLFESANLALENWYYVNLPQSLIERWAGYVIAYGTVLPGLFETTELLETLGAFKRSKITGVTISPAGRTALSILGILCLAASLLLPEYFFPLIWVAFILLLEPFNYRLGGQSFLRDMEEGNPRRLYLLLLAGWVCGLLWELWNFWASSQWIYTVPFFDEAKGFEMPFPGFLGFPPFAVQAFVMYNSISLLRTTHFRPQGKRTGRSTPVLTAIMLASFYVLLFQAIDRHTVDSFYPRLSDAYWIEPRYLRELPRVGIASLEDLVKKTADRTDRDELALRLFVPKEEFVVWVEKARLARLKGLGLENLRLLEEAGISSVPALARETPDRLRKKLVTLFPNRATPRLAKIRIWIREAQKQAQGSGSL